MREREATDVRQVLERVRTSMARVFDALVAPYEALADGDPDVALGAPVEAPEFKRPAEIRTLADDVVRSGLGGLALEQVDERAAQLEDLVADYRKGLYRETSVANWVDRVHGFRDAVFADVNTAMQAPRGWDRLALGADASSRLGGLRKETLTPQDVAPELSLNERTVRRRIQAGKLGPWVKDGSRWVITREAFMRHWADQLTESDSDVPRPPQPNHSQTELQERLEHVPLRP